MLACLLAVINSNYNKPFAAMLPIGKSQNKTGSEIMTVLRGNVATEIVPSIIYCEVLQEANQYLS